PRPACPGADPLPPRVPFAYLLPVSRQPWRCLWRTFTQMTRTTPLRRMILHFSHRVLIDGRTFMESSVRSLSPGGLRLLEPVCDAAARQVVGRQLDLDPVARQDPDEVHAHLARDVGQHAVPIVQLDAEHGVRERLDNLALHLDRVVLRLLALALLGEL